VNNRLSKRFVELEEEMERVGVTKSVSHSEMFGRSEHVDAEALLEWCIRQEKSLPLLAEFKTWLIKSKEQVISQNDLSAAIQYCLNQWEKLQRYTLDGRLSIDNNRAERGIKPFVMGRKAWMFSQTANGAKASAVLYSIVEMAKANGLTPYNYITYLLEQFSQPEQDLERLLPWNVNLG